jgi:hypothetical protein
MPLIAADPQPTSDRAPWRGLVAGTVAALAFVVVLAFTARATRDDAGPVPRELKSTPVAVVDAGSGGDVQVDGVLDAGPSNELIGPLFDAGVEGPQGPPVDALLVAARVLPVVEACLKSALRFDPSLGGRAHLTATVSPAGRISARLTQAPSSILTGCVAEGARDLVAPTAPAEEARVDAVLVVDGLRGQVRLDSAAIAP